MPDSASTHLATRRRSPDTSPAAPSGAVRLGVLTRFSLELPGHCAQPGPVGSRAERLLVLLAVHGGTVSRGTLAGTLWPEATSERARCSLRAALWSLKRRRLPLVHAGPHTLSLGADVQVDYRLAMTRAQQLIDNTCSLDDVPETLGLLRQELLSDWSEDWIMFEQQHYRQLRLHALEALCELLSRAGRHAQAVVAGLEAVTCDPLRESAHRLLMTAYLAEGNRKEAITQFHLCARLLRDELGLSPSAQMTQLLRRATGETP